MCVYIDTYVLCGSAQGRGRCIGARRGPRPVSGGWPQIFQKSEALIWYVAYDIVYGIWYRVYVVTIYIIHGIWEFSKLSGAIGIHTYIRTYVHTYIHTYTHIHACVYTQVLHHRIVIHAYGIRSR